MASSIMAVSKRMTPVNVFGFVRYDQGNKHPSTNVKRQGGAINSDMAFDTRSNSRRVSQINQARERQTKRRNTEYGGSDPNWHNIANKLGQPVKIENWGRVGLVTDVVPLTDLHYRATEASWHTGGGPMDPELDGEGVKEYDHGTMPVAQAKAKLAEVMKPAKKPRRPRVKVPQGGKLTKMPKGPRKLSKKGGFIFTKLYNTTVKA